MESNLTRSGTYSRVNLQIASFFYYLVVLASVVDSHNIVLGAYSSRNFQLWMAWVS